MVLPARNSWFLSGQTKPPSGERGRYLAAQPLDFAPLPGAAGSFDLSKNFI